MFLLAVNHKNHQSLNKNNLINILLVQGHMKLIDNLLNHLLHNFKMINVLLLRLIMMGDFSLNLILRDLWKKPKIILLGQDHVKNIGYIIYRLIK